MFEDLKKDDSEKISDKSNGTDNNDNSVKENQIQEDGVEDIFSSSSDEKNVLIRENNNKVSVPGSGFKVVDHSDEDSKLQSQFSKDPGIDSFEIEQQNKRKLLILMLMFIGIALIAWGTYFLFGKIVKKIDDSSELDVVDTSVYENSENEEINFDINSATNDNTDNQIEEINIKEINNKENNSSLDEEDDVVLEIEQKTIVDTDNDGLSDEEELKLGIDITKVDTDDDGLLDREEVITYKTDPINPDTDNDGFLDGEEVKAGYNPKGEGRLLKIK